jgi:hypothetical protein
MSTVVCTSYKYSSNRFPVSSVTQNELPLFDAGLRKRGGRFWMLVYARNVDAKIVSVA